MICGFSLVAVEKLRWLGKTRLQPGALSSVSPIVSGFCSE